MTQKAEQNKWYQGKGKIVSEYLESHEALMSAVAGRGFINAPGYLDDAAIKGERITKSKLSELNYSIVAEAIERELKQTGHDYGIAYKTARIAFELSKQQTLSDLEQEFADIKLSQSVTEEELAAQRIELAIRELVITTTKTEIAVELEGLKQELVAVEEDSLSTEILLIDAQVATAVKKLEVIPYLTQIIEAEELLIAEHEKNQEYDQSLIDAKELLIAKKEEILPLIEQKADKQVEYATAILDQIVITRSRLELAIQRAALKKTATDADIVVMLAENAVDDLRMLLISANAALKNIRLDGDLNVSVMKTLDMGTITDLREVTDTTLREYEVDAESSKREAKEYVADTGMESNENTTEISVDADQDAIKDIADIQADTVEQKANIMGSARITSELVHLMAS